MARVSILPKRLQPMLATLTDAPFHNADWVLETKWNGKARQGHHGCGGTEIPSGAVGSRAAPLAGDTDLVPLHGHPRYPTLTASGEARLAALKVEQAGKVG